MGGGGGGAAPQSHTTFGSLNSTLLTKVSNSSSSLWLGQKLSMCAKKQDRMSWSIVRLALSESSQMDCAAVLTVPL